MQRELVEDIVIVGAGIAGLTTSLGLHRYLFHFHFSLSSLFSYVSFMLTGWVSQVWC